MGQSGQGRLGLNLNLVEEEVKRDAVEVQIGIPYPYKLTTIDGRSKEAGSIVEIVAGGWSFMQEQRMENLALGNDERRYICGASCYGQGSG